MALTKFLAAGAIALSAVAFTAPAQADASFSFSIYGPNGGVTLGAGDPRYAHYDRDRNWRRDTLSPKQVQRVLRRKGFSHIDIVDRERRAYKVRATDYRGRRVALVVSARDGDILSWRRARGRA